MLRSIGQQYYFIDFTAWGSCVQLPDARQYKGKKYIFKYSAPGGSASILPFIGQTIEGNSSLELTITNQTFEIVSDGVNWKIIAAYKPS